MWLEHTRYRPDFHEAPRLLGRLESMGKRGRQRSSAYVDPRDIEGCEALLEAHFTQVLLSPLSLSTATEQQLEGRLCNWILGLCVHTGRCPLQYDANPRLPPSPRSPWSPIMNLNPLPMTPSPLSLPLQSL